jgi:hypothetical protein
MTTDHTAFKPRSRAIYHSPKKRPSRTFWIKTLAEFSKSSLSAQAFCRSKNLSASSLSIWRKRLRNEEPNLSLAPTTFIPLEVITADHSSDLSKDIAQNQHMPVFPGDDRGYRNSGLSVQFNESLNINIDKDFHEPTLQRLVKLFTSGVPSEC